MRNEHLSRFVGYVFLVTFVLYLGFYVLLSIPQLNIINAAPVWINDTAITLVNVTNDVPQVVGVVVYDATSPDDEIDLTSGAVRKVWCNGTVVDYNGKDDIIACNATIYYHANTSSDQDDRNEHYTNSSCAEIASEVYNKTFSCTFDVWFFANNGTWYCNMSAWDNGTANLDGQSAYNSSTDDADIMPLYALDVPPVMDFGELSLGQTSIADVIENVTNLGNMGLDLELYGYGGNVKTENNLSMLCTMGNITVANLRFDLTDTDDLWSGMTQLKGQFAVPNDVNGINIAQRIDENINSTNNTYWKIQIPQYSVKGQCNGTVVFTAVIDD